MRHKVNLENINYVGGDMLTQETGYLVHGVNCRGVMGSGIALTVRETYPEVFEAYALMCSVVDVPATLLGSIQPVIVGKDLVAVNLFSQDNFGLGGAARAKTGAIESGLMKLCDIIDSDVYRGFPKHIHLPKIGSLRGGLSFDTDVLPVIKKVARKHPTIDFTIWSYNGRHNK